MLDMSLGLSWVQGFDNWPAYSLPDTILYHAMLCYTTRLSILTAWQLGRSFRLSQTSAPPWTRRSRTKDAGLCRPTAANITDCDDDDDEDEDDREGMT